MSWILGAKVQPIMHSQITPELPQINADQPRTSPNYTFGAFVTYRVAEYFESISDLCHYNVATELKMKVFGYNSAGKIMWVHITGSTSNPTLVSAFLKGAETEQ